MQPDSAPSTSGSTLLGAPPHLLPTSNLAARSAWFGQPCFLGIDEAGRGPVLGPMVYAAVLAPLAYRNDLASRPYKDSKTLAEEKREQLFNLIAADGQLAFIADILPAALISHQMLSREKVSLNAIAADSTTRIIRAVIDAGADLREVYIDTVGDAERYTTKLSAVFPGLQFTICPKADALYPIVSAASIIAKVSRDHNVAQLQASADAVAAAAGRPAAKLGSGYPGDPDTKAWLAASVDKVFGFSPANNVRFSWQTTDRLLAETAVTFAWECEDGADAAQPTLALAFGAGGKEGGKFNEAAESNGTGRHSFFRARKLQAMPVAF